MGKKETSWEARRRKALLGAASTERGERAIIKKVKRDFYKQNPDVLKYYNQQDKEEALRLDEEERQQREADELLNAQLAEEERNAQIERDITESVIEEQKAKELETNDPINKEMFKTMTPDAIRFYNKKEKEWEQLHKKTYQNKLSEVKQEHFKSSDRINNELQESANSLDPESWEWNKDTKKNNPILGTVSNAVLGLPKLFADAFIQTKRGLNYVTDFAGSIVEADIKHGGFLNKFTPQEKARYEELSLEREKAREPILEKKRQDNEARAKQAEAKRKAQDEAIKYYNSGVKKQEKKVDKYGRTFYVETEGVNQDPEKEKEFEEKLGKAEVERIKKGGEDSGLLIDNYRVAQDLRERTAEYYKDAKDANSNYGITNFGTSFGNNAKGFLSVGFAKLGATEPIQFENRKTKGNLKLRYVYR
jgi:hypothetical protein